ncbi:GlxA family transcriptional regulator [Mesorhizobium sp.]|uniref:GlxA family transcriptional regulator n=1 Tax=Mesorhizobium sp. TaxID=1871066 RepID=UPI000FE8C92F|nr:GlxA family transcriptional regulator [Mesorhizobium sp.]RWB00286.1 MAG: GlxA family transcriptional regulator [Mesorhizobium sp.]RWB92702.1 MAG: GlxA family transcriptional regulator [Mesorhizobium sp.]RWP21445.1 MAG: GlxA family transcriptional regulator [Mesorhizobium sp.]RWP28610.1 MAG: GlxA family transcriptional regulator [Mesorhizobium sp.]RWP95476.1 MAG: GlxA family transcriptional regulator [Mesorhizobium sp.]
MKSAEEAPGLGRLKIGFVLARSFTLSAFALFVDTLRLASDETDRSGRILADWHVLASSRNLITSSCGVQVAPTSDFVDPGEFNYIVVVGGLLNNEFPVDSETVSYLKRAAAAKVPLIGICTGTFILAEAGLMKYHRTCVSWLHYQAFRERFPDHDVRSDRLFNLDRTRGSCAGGSSAADMAASIVRRHISREAERNALEVLQIERARSASDIQPHSPPFIECQDPRLKAALIIMENHIENTISIPKVAALVGLSRRQLERLFMEKTKSSPAIVYTRVRLERAKHLLMQTRAPMIEIAVEVGFENASHFSRLFRQTYGQPPTKFRSAVSG